MPVLGLSVLHSYFLLSAEDDVSSMAEHLEQLNLQKDDQGSEPEEGNDSVFIPNHLQHHNPECLNLSFGSFGPGANATFAASGPHTSRPLKSNLDETSALTDASTVNPSESRYVSV